MTNNAPPRPTGIRPRTMALILPSAVRASTSRLSRVRSIMVAATVCRSSARLPPTSRWIRMAMTAQRKSALSRRSAASSSASSRGRPNRDSAVTRRSSRPMGSSTSCDTASTPCIREYPARREPERSWRVPGSCATNFLRRRFAMNRRTMTGSTATSTARRSPTTGEGASTSAKVPTRTTPASEKNSASPGRKGRSAPSRRLSTRLRRFLRSASRSTTPTARWTARLSATPPSLAASSPSADFFRS